MRHTLLYRWIEIQQSWWTSNSEYKGKRGPSTHSRPNKSLGPIKRTMTARLFISLQQVRNAPLPCARRIIARTSCSARAPCVPLHTWRLSRSCAACVAFHMQGFRLASKQSHVASHAIQRLPSLWILRAFCGSCSEHLPSQRRLIEVNLFLSLSFCELSTLRFQCASASSPVLLATIPCSILCNFVIVNCTCSHMASFPEHAMTV